MSDEMKNKIPAVEMSITRRAGATVFRIKSARVEAIMQTLARGQPPAQATLGTQQYAVHRVSGGYDALINHRPVVKEGEPVVAPKDIAVQFQGMNQPIVSNQAHQWVVNLSWLTFVGIDKGIDVKLDHPFTKVQIDQMSEVLKIALKRLLEDLGKEWSVSVTLWEKGDTQITENQPGT